MDPNTGLNQTAKTLTVGTGWVQATLDFRAQSGMRTEEGPVRQTRVGTALEWLDRAISMGMVGQGRVGLLQRWRSASSSTDVGSVPIRTSVQLAAHRDLG